MTMLRPYDDPVGHDRQAFDELVVRVERGAIDTCGTSGCSIAPILHQCVEQSVASLWKSPIQTFVPLLAFRAVQECCRTGVCPDPGPASASR